MAKNKIRLNKKEVITVLNTLDLSKDFRGTGMTREELQIFRDSYLVKLNHECPDEASERAVIDELIGKLGGIFHQDIAQIDLRIANYQYQRGKLSVELQQAQALKKLFDESRQSYVDRESAGAKKATADKLDLDKNIAEENEEKTATSKAKSNNDEEIAKLNARKKELQSKLDAAKAIDKQNFYIDRYQKEYVGTLSFFGKIAFGLKGPAEKASEIEKYVAQCVAAEKGIELSADGKVTPVENPHILCPYGEDRISATGVTEKAPYGISAQQIEDEILAVQSQIDSYKSSNVEKDLSIADINKRIEQLDIASKSCQSIINVYNETLDKYTNAAVAFASKGSSLNETLSTLPDGTVVDLLTARIQATEYILNNYLDKANPLEQLAFTGYLKSLREKQSFAMNFKTDADARLQAVIQNDLSLNVEGNNVELAFEHYVLASLGKDRNIEERNKAINKYFGKYIVGIETKVKAIELKYVIASNTFDYYLASKLEPEYKGVNYQAQATAVENAVENNIQILNERARKLSQERTLTGEINLQPNDQLQIYTTNPITSRYIALTMEREKLLTKKKLGAVLTEDEKTYLACLSFKITKVVEDAKASGAIIDISNASQVAVETMLEKEVPGYDKVAEFAKLQNLSLSKEADRQALIAKQQEFRETVILSSMDVSDIERYARFVGADISTYDARQKFLAENRTSIVNFAVNNKPLIHSSIAAYEKDLSTAEGRKNLESDPQKVAEIYNTYGKNISVKYKDGKLLIASITPSKDGEGYKIGEYVETSVDKLLQYDLLKSTGMILDIEEEKRDKYREVDSKVPEISNVVEERQKYVYVQVEGNDLGLLGEASSYTTMTGEYDFEVAKAELNKKFIDGSLLKVAKSALVSSGTPLSAETVNRALFEAYTDSYKKILLEYREKNKVIRNSLERDDVETPVSTRPDGHAERAHQYDEKIEKSETPIGVYGGGRTGKILDSVVSKMEAITDARTAFEDADPEAMEIYDQALATAVVDMLGTLDSIIVSDAKRTPAENIAILNSAMQKRLQARKTEKGLTYNPTDYAIALDEEGNYSVTAGYNVYSIAEDRTVSINPREATQTVPETPTV